MFFSDLTLLYGIFPALSQSLHTVVVVVVSVPSILLVQISVIPRIEWLSQLLQEFHQHILEIKIHQDVSEKVQT